MRQPPSPSAAARRRSHAARLACRACCLLVAVAGCEEVERAAPAAEARLAADRVSLDDVVRWGGDLTLEENREVVTVFPIVTVTEAGELVVADAREAQLRVFGSEGRLRRWFGSRGEGPKEFFRPAAALPRSGGEVMGVDMGGKYAVFDAGGARVVETGRFPVNPVYTVKPMSGGQLLVVGRRPGAGSPYLHVWDAARREMVRSFFVPPVARGFEDEAIMTGVMDAAVRGDTIAALFARSDSLFLFTRDGARVGALRLPSRWLRPLAEKFPGGGREGFVRWNEGFSMLSNVFWLPDGTFLVQYYDMKGTDQRWTLLRLRRDGTPLFEVPGTPRLLAVHPDGRTLVFEKSGAEAPNQWKRAALR